MKISSLSLPKDRGSCSRYVIEFFLFSARRSGNLVGSMSSLYASGPENDSSSFRVTEENLVFETVQSGLYSSLNVFSAF